MPDDKPIENNEDEKPDYDTYDVEAPFVQHHISSELNRQDSDHKYNPTHHYMGTAIHWAWSSLQSFWRNVLWNRGFWTFAATVAIAIATVLYTHYARKQLKAINDQFPELQKSARSAESAAKIAASQLELSERPWVGAWAEMKRTDGPTMDVIDFRVFLKNTGLTPALHVHVRPGWMVQHRNYLVESDFAQNNEVMLNPERIGKDSSTVVLPNDSSISPQYGFNVHHNPRTAYSDALPYSWLYLMGEVTYDDTFGHKHSTTFCQRVEGKALLFANLHNEMN